MAPGHQIFGGREFIFQLLPQGYVGFAFPFPSNLCTSNLPTVSYLLSVSIHFLVTRPRAGGEGDQVRPRAPGMVLAPLLVSRARVAADCHSAREQME